MFYKSYFPALYNWERRKWRYSDSCSHAKLSENYFSFELGIVGCSVTNPDPLSAAAVSGRPQRCKADRVHQLYSYPDIIEKSVTSCYLRVEFDRQHRYTDVIAYSYAGSASINGTLQPGDLYGTSQDCIKGDPEFSCLEIRAPSRVSCSVKPDDIVDDNYTLLTVTAFDINDEASGGNDSSAHLLTPVLHARLNSDRFRDIDVPANHELRYEYVQRNISDTITFRVYPYMIAASRDFGLFCETMETVEAARTSARARCGQSRHSSSVSYVDSCQNVRPPPETLLPNPTDIPCYDNVPRIVSTLGEPPM